MKLCHFNYYYFECEYFQSISFSRSMDKTSLEGNATNYQRLFSKLIQNFFELTQIGLPNLTLFSNLIKRLNFLRSNVKHYCTNKLEDLFCLINRFFIEKSLKNKF